jgi:hypothetical protein
LLKSKGPKKIEIRRAFLLTASDQNTGTNAAVSGQATATKAEGDQKPTVKKNEDDDEDMVDEEIAGF